MALAAKRPAVEKFPDMKGAMNEERLGGGFGRV